MSTAPRQQNHSLRDLTSGFEAAREILGRGVVVGDQPSRITTREHAVMIGIARGDTINAIAKRLFISPTTVSTYRGRLLRKLGFTRNAQITLFVAEIEGLLR